MMGRFEAELLLQQARRKNQILEAQLVSARGKNHDETSGNYNVCLIGPSGSGKTILMQDMALSILSVEGKVIVFDGNERCWKHLCDNLGGTYVKFDPSNAVSINPFYMIPTGSDALSKEAREDFLQMFPYTLAAMAALEQGVTDLQHAFLSQALKVVWESQGSSTQIDDIADYLLEHDDVVAQDLGKKLFNYTCKGIYGGFFSGKCELKLDSDMIVIDVGCFWQRHDLAEVITQTVAILFNQTITEAIAKEGSVKPNVLMFDEILLRLSSSSSTLSFIRETMCIARLNKTSVVVTTHLLDEFSLLGEAGENIFEYSSFKIIFKQNADTLRRCQEIPFLRHYVQDDSNLRKLQSDGSFEFTLWGAGVNGDISHLELDPFTMSMMINSQTARERFDYGAKGLRFKHVSNNSFVEKNNSIEQ